MSYKPLVAAGAAALSFAAPAHALQIGVFGSDPYSTFLNASGHTSTSLGSDTSNAALLAGLDVVILNRTVGSQAIIDFVAAGGAVITEWDASAWALNTAGLLDADDVGGAFVASGTVISFTAAGQATNLDDLSGASYSSDGATEYFRNFDNIGAGVEVLATRPGDEAVILAGSYGAGSVLVMGYDWNDQTYSLPVDNGNEQVLLQAVEFRADGSAAPAIPVPAALPLMATALGALGLAARRRRS